MTFMTSGQHVILMLIAWVLTPSRASGGAGPHADHCKDAFGIMMYHRRSFAF